MLQRAQQIIPNTNCNLDHNVKLKLQRLYFQSKKNTFMVRMEERCKKELPGEIDDRLFLKVRTAQSH